MQTPDLFSQCLERIRRLLMSARLTMKYIPRVGICLFASAERMCGRYWSESNDQMKLFYILNGFDNLSYLSNFNFFHQVQRYIISSCRFSPVFL